MVLVCAGTADAKRAMLTDQQLADRFEAVELPPWHNDNDFRRLLASFQALLPLRKKSDLSTPDIRQEILRRTEGITVRIVRLLEQLAVEAVRSGSEEIALDRFSLLDSQTPLFPWKRMRKWKLWPVTFRPKNGEVLYSVGCQDSGGIWDFTERALAGGPPALNTLQRWFKVRTKEFLKRWRNPLVYRSRLSANGRLPDHLGVGRRIGWLAGPSRLLSFVQRALPKI